MCLPIENVKFSFGQIRLLQQMAMEKCVVAPETISLSDYGRDKETIIFYKPEDINSCKEAIEFALNNVSLRNKIASNAKKSVCSEFTEKNMGREIEKEISRIV